MKTITKSYLKSQDACPEGVMWFQKQKKKDLYSLVKNLYSERKDSWVVRFLYRKVIVAAGIIIVAAGIIIIIGVVTVGVVVAIAGVIQKIAIKLWIKFNEVKRL